MRTFAGGFKKTTSEIRLHLGIKQAFCTRFALILHRFSNMSESCTASSLGIPQGGNAARVLGCSGAIQSARSPASLAQLARARDL